MLEFDKLYSKITADIKAEIESEKEQFIVATDIKQLVDYFCQHRMLIPIEIDDTREITAQIETKLDTSLPSSLEKFKAMLEKKGDFEIETLIIEIPIKPKPTNITISQLYGHIPGRKMPLLHLHSQPPKRP